MRSLAIIFAVVAAVLAAPASAAPAAPSDLLDRARAHSEMGRRHYELGDYRAAISSYRAAYLLLPSPGVLFDLGQAYRMAGDCAAAAQAYRSFLRSDATGPARKLARHQLTRVDDCARKAEAASVVRDRRLRKAGVVTLAVGVVATASATYFAIDADRAASDVATFTQRGGRWADIAETDARRRRSGSRAIGFGVAGGVAVTTGVVLYALGRHHAPAQSTVWIAPGRGGASVGASWRF